MERGVVAAHGPLTPMVEVQFLSLLPKEHPEVSGCFCFELFKKRMLTFDCGSCFIGEG